MFDLDHFLKTLPNKPGIYQMIDAQDDIIYIGKARNLKNRVSTYFKKGAKLPKTERMVQQIARVELTITHSENEALLLESTLIKSHRPKYNVLMRDDKSYPYIFISTKHAFPRMDVHRGVKREKGEYFGPYPSGGAVREAINLLQKLFLIRSCKDSFYSARTRPCLQYQIGRCTAPCVGYVSEGDYHDSIEHALLFLQGKSQQVMDQLMDKMQRASDNREFEQAAKLRDLTAKLRAIQEQQYVSRTGGDIDVLAVVEVKGLMAVNILFVRAGRVIGNKTFFPKCPANTSKEELLSEFLPQYYFSSLHKENIPETLVTNVNLPEKTWFESVLSEENKSKVSIQTNVRAKKAQWLKLAMTNCVAAIQSRLSSKMTMQQRLSELQNVLKLDAPPARIECFDISHSSGEATVASCVVFDENGPLKSDYRRFNIKDIQGGDDYAAMAQALTRRYKKAKEKEAKLPDVLLIDGGKGQINRAISVLEELQVNDVLIIGIAKGEGRKAEFDRLFIQGQKTETTLSPQSQAMHLIQQVRDEAHRFAIAGHRNQRGKARTTSSLEGIDGVGAKRRQALLKRFGGLHDLKGASVDEIAKVPGISQDLAQKIYDFLH